MFPVPKPGMAVPLVEACAEFVDGVACRDVPVSEESLWVRIFFPRRTSQADDRVPKPVVLYAHGGAYCFGQPNWNFFHSFCASMCRLSDCIWVSLSYRLAPAHRLPAAYDDASFTLRWLASQQQQPSQASDPWLTSELADFSNCFLAGESAGAAIMLKAAMDANLQDLKPLCIKGLLLVHPGFHSEEMRGVMVDKELDNMQVDQMYAMALPVGETLDYPPVNPIHAAAPPLTPLSAYPHILICVAEKDFRYNMTMKFDAVARGYCPHVVLLHTPGKGHAFHIFDPSCTEAQDLRTQIASFVRASIAA